MGRYYCGSIEGKFWFGIQGSDDISNLVTITPETCYTWKVCQCCANIDDGYCTECYDSKEEHEEEAIEEDRENEDNDLYIESQMIIYRLKKDKHYEELNQSMATLRLKIEPEIIAEFDKIEQNDNILDAFTGVFNDSVTKLKEITTKRGVDEASLQNQIVARYTIGYQLEYCLRTTSDDCYVDCEC